MVRWIVSIAVTKHESHISCKFRGRIILSSFHFHLWKKLAKLLNLNFKELRGNGRKGVRNILHPYQKRLITNLDCTHIHRLLDYVMIIMQSKTTCINRLEKWPCICLKIMGAKFHLTLLFPWVISNSIILHISPKKNHQLQVMLSMTCQLTNSVQQMVFRSRNYFLTHRSD